MNDALKKLLKDPVNTKLIEAMTNAPQLAKDEALIAAQVVQKIHLHVQGHLINTLDDFENAVELLATIIEELGGYEKMSAKHRAMIAKVGSVTAKSEYMKGHVKELLEQAEACNEAVITLNNMAKDAIDDTEPSTIADVAEANASLSQFTLKGK